MGRRLLLAVRCLGWGRRMMRRNVKGGGREQVLVVITASGQRREGLALATQPDLWCKFSEKYINWRQLEILGLMSKGNWA